MSDITDDRIPAHLMARAKAARDRAMGSPQETADALADAQTAITVRSPLDLQPTDWEPDQQEDLLERITSLAEEEAVRSTRAVALEAAVQALAPSIGEGGSVIVIEREALQLAQSFEAWLLGVDD